MIKPVNVWEALMWGSLAVIPLCAVITAVVRRDPAGTWATLMSAMIVLIAAVGERRRLRQQRIQD
ncbi:hypothetical protein SAMN04487904_103365 [Actinopolyspora lacussalsi subsp. righensis]|uniref:MYXO-CTERM domain-containing protein n=1 Tax=Actinopolyspora righensis TaxID=995060 RepID=A0A1I6YY02_9ACTN|nr:hypothetical protein [Actinopolyspora righensis]SFT55294.1 hypothetical protein SAMN04487904_103365 [Actinopolyspora righensis]